MSNNIRIIKNEDAEVFYGLFRNLRNTQSEGVRGSVDLYRPEWYDERRASLWTAIHSVEGKPEVFAVAAVLSNRELVSICAKPGNHVETERFIQTVIDHEKPLFLRCLDTPLLNSLYHSLGFKFLCAMKWDDDLKPEGWNCDKYGKPDYAVYISPYAPNYEECEEDRLMFVQYELMAEYVKSQIGEDMDCKPFQPRVPARPKALERTEKDKAFCHYRYLWQIYITMKERARRKSGVSHWHIFPFRSRIVSTAWQARKEYHKHIF